MAPYRACSLLALALLCAVAAAKANSQPMSSFEAYLRSGNARATSADRYHDEGYHHNFVNLVETSQKDCRFLDDDDVWTSEMACRQESYGHQEASIVGDNLMQASGMCRWTVRYFEETGPDDQGDIEDVCGFIPVPTLPKTYVVGTATARCTFPRGDACGEPLCNSLVVTVSGELYATTGYTKSSTGTQDSVFTCGTWEGYFSELCGDLDLPGITEDLRKSSGGKQARKINKRRSRGARKHAHKKTGGQSSQKKAKTEAGIASANYGYEEEERQAELYYPATALIISGSITSINGQKYDKEGRYTDGTVQYVTYVAVEEGATAVANRPDGLVLTPQSYNFGFVKDGVKYYSN